MDIRKIIKEELEKAFDKDSSEFIIDKYGDKLKAAEGWGSLKIPVSEYKTNVKDCLVHIITDENGISEKSFSQYDEVIKEVADFFNSNEKMVNLISDFESKSSRPEYAAEKIYDEFYHSNNENYLNETKKKSKFQKLEDNKVPLTDEERSEVMKRKAVWHHGPGGAESPAVWKSKDPKTGKFTFITNTHRAYNTAPTLKGAIGRYHKFIKGTA
ncbi:MAG: hypothetical protein AABY15_05410 [Nanoarchaeota archaeon]